MRTSKEEMSWQEKRNADRKERGENKRRGRGEAEVSREPGLDSRGFFFFQRSAATVPAVLSSLPPIVIPGSVGAGEAANSSDIYAVFSASSLRRGWPRHLSAPTMASGG